MSTLPAAWRWCRTPSFKGLPAGLWALLLPLALSGYALSIFVSHGGYFRFLGLPLACCLFWRSSKLAAFLMGSGFSLNVIAMAANGWMMPIAPNVVVGPLDGSHTLLDPHSRFAFLADRFYSAVSLGDLIIALGVLVFCLSLLRSSRQAAKPV